ncbi:hypothetical protein RDI58_010157 [Solanum bulbocastanum]|uniref:Protein kinase domain-containing protein n=1 Tax=Solanum bulbocastanum TaxID=147425 RepID=A0AAN8TVX6_SOLBU
MEKHIFLLILLLVIQYYSVASSIETDQQALLLFQNLITSPNHFLANNWTKNTSFCTWFGVTCSPKRHRIVALEQFPIFGQFVLPQCSQSPDNSFHGGIPYDIGHVPSFGEMWRGPWYVPELRVLNLTNNSLTGMITPSVGNATKLLNFSLFGNRVGGNIPKEIGNLSQLAFLSLFDNQLTVGQIPPQLGKLSNLRQLSFDHNFNLIGRIPEAIFNISSFEVIDFSFNNLSGKIPITTGLHLPNLKGLNLGLNQLEGEIPLFITNASKLEIVALNDNFLTGTIPNNLENLHELRKLLLHHNQLTNEPRERELLLFNSLADCKMLKYLQVGFKLLNGVLPNSIGNLSPTIQNFEIGDAHINGLIPTGISNMSGLMTLDFQGNNLTGNIPSDVGKLKQLQGLYLTNNKLQGHVPEAVCHFSNLVKLFLNGNELSGLIPECLGNLSMLQKLFLGSNKFSSKFPLNLWKLSDLLYLSVSRNSIEGEVSSDIGELKAIVGLYLHSNHFSGVIPTRFGELQNLQYLDLSNNSFFGQIPLTFANLISLEVLNLSSNALSGTIPKSLEKLSYLKSNNVSFNDLEGVIPSGGVFANSTLQSFLGSKGLCGVHILEIPACAINNPGKQSNLKENKGKSKDVEKLWLCVQRHIVWGTAVAIKVLDLENEQVCKRFDTECKVMRNVRHRYLVSVITTCSSDYIRAFVLQFMPNGSLENWLYREDLHLNLHQRVTVMLDAAMAVEYLHHGHVTPIVHCDLKPANILLDEDMVAHVGDFGISKILAISKSMAYTETLGTLGYIAPVGLTRDQKTSDAGLPVDAVDEVFAFPVQNELLALLNALNIYIL